ncbi:MAG: GNAT family N-acetyltransferase [Deltaproteobacteria bacterium]|nr:GNAT family N-acetyltransferase [Deltaproteobacteria bacterium]
MNIQVRKAMEDDSSLLADIIRRSFAEVARLFHLNPENCPTHPSNCTEEWIKNDLQKGKEYFIIQNEGRPVGCVCLFQRPDRDFELGRLAVLPQYRHRGLGKDLVDHSVLLARQSGAKRVEIGIIARQKVLADWYKSLGFTDIGIKQFKQLPFDVAFMELIIL